MQKLHMNRKRLKSVLGIGVLTMHGKRQAHSFSSSTMTYLNAHSWVFLKKPIKCLANTRQYLRHTWCKTTLLTKLVVFKSHSQHGTTLFYVTAPFKQSLHVHRYTSCNAVGLDVLLNYPLSQKDAVWLNCRIAHVERWCVNGYCITVPQAN